MCCTNLCHLLNWACCLSYLPASLLTDCFPPYTSLLSVSSSSVSLLLSPSDVLVHLCFTSSQSALRTVFNLYLCPSSCQSMCPPFSLSLSLVFFPCISISISPLGFVVSGFPKLNDDSLWLLSLAGFLSICLYFLFPSILFTLCMSSDLAG